MRDHIALDPGEPFQDIFKRVKQDVFRGAPPTYAEFCKINYNTEYYSYLYRYLPRCPDPIYLTANSEILEYADFRTGELIQEKFRHVREGRTHFFLPKMLYVLKMGDVVGDGTFHICRHLKYAQIYILVSTIRQGDRIFTMPIWYSLMEKRREIDYNDMFSDLQYYYNLYYNETLHIPRIRIDMERATFNSIEKNFENSELKT